jgi:hypothetical protein
MTAKVVFLFLVLWYGVALSLWVLHKVFHKTQADLEVGRVWLNEKHKQEVAAMQLRVKELPAGTTLAVEDREVVKGEVLESEEIPDWMNSDDEKM